VTYYAHWTIKTYTVTFKDYNGATLVTRTVNHGAAATAPANPTRTGYSFTGWNMAFTNVTANLTVTAQYKANTYTVTFKDYNGTTLVTRTVNHGAAASAPAAPARTGYTFTGWDKAFTNVTASLTVTAQYTINTYTVTFNPSGGSVTPATVAKTYNSALGTLPVPTRSGYVFDGWYTAASGGTKIATTTKVTANVIYYAHWAADNLNGAVVSISTALSRSRVLDIPGMSTQQGVRPALWDSAYTPNQRFKMSSAGNGYYFIKNVRSNLYLDLSGSRATNNNTVVQWAYHGGDNQKWKFVLNANGSYTIVSKVNESFCLDLPASSSAKSTQIALYKMGTGQKNQQFYLDAQSSSSLNGIHTLASAALSNRLIDIKASSLQDGASALLWTKTGNSNQSFRFTYNANTGYYSITAIHSGKVFDVTGPGASQGSEVIQWTSHGGYNQQWYIAPAANNTYAIYSASSGMTLDVKGGVSATSSPGGPVIIWPYHGGANQRWVL
jgi:uncharacterized repeat protein (TIGR02543 family)